MFIPENFDQSHVDVRLIDDITSIAKFKDAVVFLLGYIPPMHLAIFLTAFNIELYPYNLFYALLSVYWILHFGGL